MVPLALMALYALKYGGALAGLFGQKKRPSIDPEWIKQNFGAGAVNTELQDLFNKAINSSQGQALMTNAAQSGQQFQSDVARGAAQAGLGAGGGASSGTDVFASAGAGQATANIQRNMKANLMESMLPIAQQIVQGRLAAYMKGEGESPFQPTMGSEFGNLLSNAASLGIANYPSGNTQGNTSTSRNTGVPDSEPTPGPTSPTPPSSMKPMPAGGAAAAPAGGGGGGAQTVNMTPPKSMLQKPSFSTLGLGGDTGGPSMRDVQQQLQATAPGASRFYSKMSRFNGNMSNAVQR